MITPRTSLQAGYLMVVVLVFSGIFLTILTSFVVFVVTQSRLIEQKIAFEQAGQIAEAGLDYMKWYLAHYPNATTTTITNAYNDPESGAIGQYTITATSTTFCGAVASLNITSVGYTDEFTNVRRTISARYARPNVAEYSFILNDNVWAGPDRIINGPYHSNGGIRMDARHNSSVTSAQNTWNCTSGFGCTPSGSRAGVFTTSGNATPALFDYPQGTISFTDLTVDLGAMEQRALTGGGIFLPKAPNGDDGYRITFNGDNTVTIRRVQTTYSYWGQTTENGWQLEDNVINTLRTGTDTRTINPNCPLIVAQDRVWLSGVVNGKVAIAASHATSTFNPSIIIQDNITYSSATTSGLVAIAERDVLLGVDVPTNLNINGIFIAQTGRYGRNFYCDNTAYCSFSQLMPNNNPNLRQFVIRNSETHNGTIVSNGRVGTQWVSGSVTSSGFLNRFTSYDRNLIDNPPPFIPTVSDVYQYSDWRDAN
ncbi:MAG: hypothetical protein RLZZ70_373 [Candidatus Parcubacteria bacterium]|jgi:hypothetical protein